MLGRKTRPVIGNLITGASGSGYKSGVYDVVTSPKSPLDLIKIQSPRNLKNYGAVGVGLGIVAALEKTIETGIQIQNPEVLYNQKSIRSVPIPVNSVKNRGISEEIDGDSLEDYTYVTSHGPNQKSHTRVYYDGCGKTRGGSDRKSSNNHRMCVFSISPAPASPAVTSPVTTDFLSSCCMCQKSLQGEDIYMYRGEKGFCSTECREKQILIDEKKENKCNSQASKSATTASADVSISPYNTNVHQMFTRGIFAI